MLKKNRMYYGGCGNFYTGCGLQQRASETQAGSFFLVLVVLQDG